MLPNRILSHLGRLPVAQLGYLCHSQRISKRNTLKLRSVVSFTLLLPLSYHSGISAHQSAPCSIKHLQPALFFMSGWATFVNICWSVVSDHKVCPSSSKFNIALRKPFMSGIYYIFKEFTRAPTHTITLELAFSACCLSEIIVGPGGEGN